MAKSLLFSCIRRCPARSPEGARCRRRKHADGLHVPLKGRGWAWGGNYGKDCRDCGGRICAGCE